MSEELKTQILGILLAIMTAVGCIGYERLVKSLPYKSLLFFVWFQYFWIWLILLFVQKGPIIPSFSYWKQYKWPIIILLVSGVTSPLWYWLTRKHSILVSGVFEIKYIIILGILAVIFGEQKPTINTWIGAFLAILSVYFISKK
jgi:drug/metabolite transporter (DMT)-like permease